MDQNDSLIVKTISKKRQIMEVQKQKPWLVCNLFGALILSYYLHFEQECYELTSTFLWYSILVVCLILVLNFTTGIYFYVKRTKFDPPVILSPQQKKLLGVRNDEIGFVTSTPACSPITKRTPLIPYIPVGSSPTVSAAKFQQAVNQSAGNSSLQFQKGSSSSVLYTSQNWDLEDELYEEDSFMKMCKSVEREELQTSRVQGQDATGMSTTASSWHYSPSASGIADFSPLLKKYSYQLSFTVPTTGTSGVDENASTKSPAKIKGRDVWQQLGISDSQLLEYNEQFRLWLSSTVLQPLVAEIQRINESLTAHGLADARIGESSLEKLRKTCQLAPVSANIPSLVEVLPYLEVTSHQDYLFRCLNRLASGGCLGNFRWDGGTKRKDVDDSTPTDSAVIMHCLATYLDSQLPAFTDRPDRRPFTGQYLVKCPEKPQPTSNPQIVEVQLNPPHYKLVMGPDEYELPKGRNNMLHSVILFFWLIKTKFEGRIGRITLGEAGLNLLWIFN
ncbi:transmembrane protein 209-like isoform X2 [Daphnia carinata]|uniref:transmembrane protein 209-like isoform X2 n=1 Tax=Daphnia carinata TaxID=120202 RepID=UPI0025803CB4|nr:transmembrane protein 209-like isoform X2 [Daphnia carinata]